MKKNRNTIFLGLFIIAIGIIFLGNNLNIWNIEIFFDGWWSLFIIIPSLKGLLKREDILSSILGLTIGILLLLAAQSLISWDMVGKIFIPTLIIVIGFSLVLKSTKKISQGESFTFFGIFSGTEEKVTSKIANAKCIAIFGGIDLDLTKAKLKEDITIDCITIFGGTDIKVPENVEIKTSGVPFFGGVENLSNNETNNDSKTIYINYVCLFGGIDIK